MRNDHHFTFGEIIVLIRKHLGLSRKEFASRMGISATTLGRYERNEMVPSCVFLIKLSHEFGIDVDSLYEPRVPVPQIFPESMQISSQEPQTDSYIIEDETPILFAENNRGKYKTRQMNYVKMITSLFYQHLESEEIKEKIKEKIDIEKNQD